MVSSGALPGIRRMYDAGLTQGNRNMRRIIAAIVLSLVAPMAFAGQPTAKQIDEVLELTHAQALLESSLRQVEKSQRDMLDQVLQEEKMSPEERAKLDAMFAKMSKTLQAAMSWEKLRPVYHRIYMASFEAQDVDAIIAFYRTPAGQRLIERTPALIQNTMSEIQAVMLPAMQQFQQEVTAELEARRAAEHKG
jgi:hypothetical protein